MRIYKNGFFILMLLIFILVLFGCDDKKFSLEGPIHHVVFDKERYSPNEEATIKIFKTRTTDITEPLALFKIVNKEGTIFKTVDDLTKLESRDNYYRARLFKRTL